MVWVRTDAHMWPVCVSVVRLEAGEYKMFATMVVFFLSLGRVWVHPCLYAKHREAWRVVEQREAAIAAKSFSNQGSVLKPGRN